jgi:metal-sulfur cluster biosynthetic enzyme
LIAAAALPGVETRLFEALHDVTDAELPLDVVDLGLIYDCATTRRDAAGRRGHDVHRDGPPGDGVHARRRPRAAGEPEVESVRVHVVWDPPWTKSRLTERGAAALMAWGIV